MQGCLGVANIGDGPYWPRDLDCLVRVVSDSHELGHCRSIEDHVICSPEAGHIKEDPFGPKVVRRAEDDR